MKITILFVAAVFVLAAADPDVESLIQNGHWKRARAAAEANYKAHPNDARAAWLMARVRRAFQNSEEAVKYGEQAVRLDPKNAAYHRTLAVAYENHIGKISVFRQLGYAHNIRTELEAALASAPNDPENISEQIDYLLNAPGVAGGDKKKAIELANNLVKIDAVKGYHAQARVARAQKEEAKLEGLYQKAVEANPKSYDARVALASFYSGASHQNSALMEQHAKTAVELNPDRAGGYRLLAYALAFGKRMDELAKVLSQSEAAVPDDLSPYVYAARGLLATGGELTKAESYLRKYLAETKEPEPGAPILAGARWSLGLVYEKQGRAADARHELEAALRLKPDFEAAKRDLKRLK